MRKLADALKEIDKKRVEDNEKILKEIAKLGKTISSPPSIPPRRITTGVTNTISGAPVENGYEYFIKSGDSYSGIAQAFSRDQGIKVTAEQIEKANPGLDPTKLKLGQRIIIPTPPQP